MQIKKTVMMKKIEKTFQEDMELLITMFRKKNKSFGDIGRLFGVHESTVGNWAERLGIDIEVKKPAWNKGKKLSKETCLKMSLSRTGENHPFWGKHHTEETKRKISEHNAHFWKGKHFSERTTWNKGKHNVYSKETLEKMRKAQLGKHHSEETKQKMSEAKLGTEVSNETRKKLSKVHKGKPLSKEHREKLSKAKKGKPLSEAHKKALRKPKREGVGEKICERMLNRSEEEIRKCLIKRVPSSLEKRFIDIIDKSHLPYKFVGNGEFFIERKNPDFINVNGEKIAVEVYCTKHKERFHKGGVEGWKKEREEIFKKYGWKIEYFNELQINEQEITTRLG